ncbi:eukaryotic translation initiation factor 3 subunit C-like [Convolutriloba macropyga]|uniref:eukaryotic translation initiation factor 3 subunit C-like n=1 Tax=Convolutriloba macropyga TaxID=536237 RepID=UPI003F523CF1
MSRFFQVSDSSSSDSESDLSDHEEVQVVTRKTAAKPQNKFNVKNMFGDEAEDEKRVVVSARDKRFEELKNTIKSLKNSKKINDFSSIMAQFEDLTKVFEKSKTILARAGDDSPEFYIKCIADLEDFITESWEDKELRARLNKTNGKSLGTLRQRIRKYNKDFEEDIKRYRDNPWESGEEVEADMDVNEPDSDDDMDDQGFSRDEIQAMKEGKPAAKDDESSVSSWGGSSDSSTVSSVEIKKEGEKYVFKNIAQYFLKKETSEKVQTKESNKEKDLRKQQRRKEKELEKKQRREAEEAAQTGAMDAKEKPKIFPKESEVTYDMMMKKFNDVISNRGKKGTDKYEQIEILTELLGVTELSGLGEGVACKIYISLISSIFDLNTNIFESMKMKHWLLALEHLEKICDLVCNNISTLKVDPSFKEEDELLKKPTPGSEKPAAPAVNKDEGSAEGENKDKEDKVNEGEDAAESGVYKVNGCVLTMINRLATEFTKVLQDSDCHSTDYIDKLRYEPRVYQLIVKCQSYLEQSGHEAEQLCKCYLARLELLYYKFDPSSVSSGESGDTLGAVPLTPSANGVAGKEPGGQNSAQVVDKLCKFIYTNDKTNWIRTRAVLCQIFHLALHDRWFQARDLMLMSHLQESIQFADVETQILYNRTLVQLGLCAFRHGNIRVAHDALLDIQSSGRKKELLAQGLSTRTAQERTAEQEKIERRRQQAFHTHINLDLLECVYLVSAMLLEIPYMACHEGDTKRRMISKSFHNQLKQSERQPLPGPPENMHEHVIAAAKAMRMGEWRKCYGYIVNAKMNSRVWDLFPRPESVKLILKRKIQEESLRAYLFTFGSKFSTISLDNLAQLFELEKHTVHSIVSKLIITEELQASWDEPSNCIVAHRSDPSSVQKLCNQLSEKLNHLVESNERLLEAMGNKNMHYMFQSSGRDHNRDNKGDRNQDSRGEGGNRGNKGGDRQNNRQHRPMFN